MKMWHKAACGAFAVAAVVSPLGAQTFVEPTWPQAYSLERGDHAAYGIAVGAPGPIGITVSSTGVVVVTLTKPNGTIAKELQGAGSVRMDYMVTKEDVATGLAWRVAVRTTAGSPATAGRINSALSGPGVSGTIATVHPAGDASRIRFGPTKTAAPPPPGLFEAALAAVQAAHARLTADTQAKQLAAATAKLMPKAPTPAPAPITAKVAGTRAATPPPAGVLPAQGTSATSGTTQLQDLTAPPAIASLDVASGSPGRAVLITGTGFGPSPSGGEVHFIVSPANDRAGAITYWSETQIIARVPSITGVGPFAGQLYVRRGTSNSRLVPFGFEPELAYDFLPISNDQVVTGGGFFVMNAGTHEVWHDGYFGIKGDDQFFLHATLKNGWGIDDAYVVQPQNPNQHAPDISDGTGDAYVSQFTPGSSSPRITVHWWGESNVLSKVVVRYWPVVIIRGPKGLPW